MLTIREKLGTATARVLASAVAELSTRIAEFRADLAVGEVSGMTPARLAYARALANKIGVVVERHGHTLPRLAEYARTACNDLDEVETAIRGSD